MLHRLALLAALVASGCTSLHTVPIDQGVEIVQTADPVVLTFADGRAVRAASVRLEADSTSWVDLETNALRSAPTVEVAWVDQIQRRRGGAQGLAVAFVTGTVLATLYYSVGRQNAQGGDIGRDLRSGAIAGLFAAPVGALVGGAVGARDRSVFTVGPVYIGPEPALVPRPRGR